MHLLDELSDNIESNGFRTALTFRSELIEKRQSAVAVLLVDIEHVGDDRRCLSRLNYKTNIDEWTPLDAASLSYDIFHVCSRIAANRRRAGIVRTSCQSFLALDSQESLPR